MRVSREGERLLQPTHCLVSSTSRFDQIKFADTNTTMLATLPCPASRGHVWSGEEVGANIDNGKCTLAKGPNLIIASTTLAPNWKYTLEQFLKPHVYDIFTWETAQGNQFMEYYKSLKQPESHHIVIASNLVSRSGICYNLCVFFHSLLVFLSCDVPVMSLTLPLTILLSLMVILISGKFLCCI